MSSPQDRRRILLAAGLIQAHGHQQDGVYHLDQVQLDKGPDGYQICLHYNGVNLNLGFHHTLNSDAANRRELEAFYDRLDRIIKNYS
ncbi:DUF3081 family protein [Pseudoteredinibacter isoporae]|uniref:DUF3081 domain-containing protein n=1 Tax=Pseudoteredinibacter isoporae TaxID=570281 RepID=A0A7X0JPU2_9GAMM|nr:DUF3081 family protein [Pseudoteredinibacter isoporae]MBB6520093.1 hypothetical protein [Pseudoteredinibacter isoporae]NHO85665.1 DUF3081 domain-containing protein [Pseudoteredinibacter isoporae]NIB25883.1 DUF3081 domain-containing protein [Pseudoteredinibacter isoporae]